MKILFCGDIFLGGDLVNFGENIFDFNEFHDADVRFVNLESPITDSLHQDTKATLFAPTSSVRHLVNNKITFVNLANNHFQDKGIEGVEDTIKVLENNSINHVGVGLQSQKFNTIQIHEKLFVLTYCEKNTDYLKKVKLATENEKGLRDLNYQNIIEDLESLPEDSKAILYLHWGREHVFLPPKKIIDLALKLIEHPKVITIIGMHPHVVQGIIERSGKMIYFSLGNFLFPNFYYKPRRTLFYSNDYSDVRFTTYSYHKVLGKTYKKWKEKNRISLLVQFDTESNKCEHFFTSQDENKPIVRKLDALKSNELNKKIEKLGSFYQASPLLYRIVTSLEKIIFYDTLKIYTLKKVIFQWFSIRFNR